MSHNGRHSDCLHIEIYTDGFGRNTHLYINGERVTIMNFRLSVTGPDKPVSFQADRVRKNGTVDPLDLFADAFQHYGTRAEREVLGSGPGKE